MTGEEAAAEVLRKRRVFAKLRKRIAEGDRSRRTVREVGEHSRELANVLARFDGPPRATWSSFSPALKCSMRIWTWQRLVTETRRVTPWETDR
jgi:hypothetical protein